MITVPTSTASRPSAPASPAGPRPSDAFLMMAAAQMHSEGRLVQSDQGPDQFQIPPTVRSGHPTAPPQPSPPPPEPYWPSNGRRDKPAMMT